MKDRPLKRSSRVLQQTQQEKKKESFARDEQSIEFTKEIRNATRGNLKSIRMTEESRSRHKARSKKYFSRKDQERKKENYNTEKETYSEYIKRQCTRQERKKRERFLYFFCFPFFCLF